MNSRPHSLLSILRQRRQGRDARRRSALARTKKAVFGLGVMLSVLAVLALLAAAVGYASLTRDLPPLEALEVALDPGGDLMTQPTRLYDRSGEILLVTLAPAGIERAYTPYEKIPQALVDATLALVQPDFWESPGYVLPGWEAPELHPTLAQQVVADFLLADEAASPARSLRERLLAAQVLARFGREQVIEWYLNTRDYGHYAYGVEAAAQLYFGKPASRLSLSEAAMLAAVGQAPDLNPLDSPSAAETNRLETLRTLLSLGWISAEEVRQAINEVPEIADNEDPTEELLAEPFVDLVLHQLDEAYGAGRLQRGGVSVRTSIDASLQMQSECALRAQWNRLAGNTEPITAVDGSVCDTASLLPGVQMEPVSGQITAGALVLDPSSGQVLAAAGDLSPHPAGTAITPFIYLTGFARGLNPASLGWDIPSAEPLPGQTYAGAVRLRLALANDYLPPARAVLAQTGMENVLATAASFGLDLPSEGLLDEDFLLTPFELASAYAILAAGGQQAGLVDASSATLTYPEGRFQPAAVLEVTHADGSPWPGLPALERRQVVSEELAYLLTHVLSDAAARWPSLGDPNPLEIDHPAAVKAAHTLDGSGAWTAGYTPRRVVLVFLSGAGASSRSAADGLWNAITRYAVQDLPAAGWEMPAGIVTLKVCDPSGLLPTRACPNVVDEIFLEGRQPVQYDSLYQEFEINIETGLLATVFTPPELVERRVYMVPPPEALLWAAAVGIEAPPSTYDTYKPVKILPDVQITNPGMFSDGRGVISIRGSAAGGDFVSYRLEYGEGLNPERWILLGGDVGTPVEEGLLASWDTSGMNGLYALRLMVVRVDDSVDQAVVQLTLDNLTPTVLVLSPQPGQEFDLGSGSQTAFQVQVQDAFLSEVVFYIDGEEEERLSAAPFGFLWEAEAGEHVLVVTATDRAGNSGVAEVEFSVK